MTHTRRGRRSLSAASPDGRCSEVKPTARRDTGPTTDASAETVQRGDKRVSSPTPARVYVDLDATQKSACLPIDTTGDGGVCRGLSAQRLEAARNGNDAAAETSHQEQQGRGRGWVAASVSAVAWGRPGAYLRNNSQPAERAGAQSERAIAGEKERGGGGGVGGGREGGRGSSASAAAAAPAAHVQTRRSLMVGGTRPGAGHRAVWPGLPAYTGPAHAAVTQPSQRQEEGVEAEVAQRAELCKVDLVTSAAGHLLPPV
ncbi:uncharacterized protein LOC124623159 [Schistocerca americana]|uniref:uncharacterized protein LOC124623159 n=1 Tax=Schistocerca americana TaxID=7009 RepID=UPI001F4F622E|nr:uncharacterized protein LOC124623159 [Schistocerca americana]